MSKQLKFIITGTGRCGTVFVARLLTSAGIPCSHEGVFSVEGLEKAQEILDMGTIQTSEVSLVESDWLTGEVVAESSYMAAPFLSKFRQSKIIHIVRNPLQVVRSFYFDAGTFKKKCPEVQIPYQEFIYQHLPDLRKIKNELRRVVYYVVKWNRLIENQQPHCRLRIEDYQTDAFLEAFGIKPNPDLFSNSKVNSWDGGENKLSLDDIPNWKIKDEFMKMMKRYKYKPCLFL